MSLALRIIPCLDVANARVVKGVNFENLRDAGDPIELAHYYFASGADELTFLDVNATNENRSTTYEMVSRVAEQVFIPLTVGGGVRSLADVDALLSAGADKVSIASAAVSNPQLIDDIAKRFGNQVLVLSLDAKRDAQGQYVVTTNGGRVTTEKFALDWVGEAVSRGVGEVLLNSIDADGTKNGFDLEMTSAVRAVCTVPLIASGGAGALHHFVDVAATGVDAILAASILHNRETTILDVKTALKAAGHEVRL